MSKETKEDDDFCIKSIIDNIPIVGDTIYYISIGSMCHNKKGEDTCLSQIFPRFIYLNSQFLLAKKYKVHLIVFNEFREDMMTYVLENLELIGNFGESVPAKPLHDCPETLKSFAVGDNLRIDFIAENFPFTVASKQLIFQTLAKEKTMLGKQIDLTSIASLMQPRIDQVVESVQTFVTKADEVGSYVFIANFAKFLRESPDPNFDYLSLIKNKNYMFLGWAGYGRRGIHKEILSINDNHRRPYKFEDKTKFYFSGKNIGGEELPTGDYLAPKFPVITGHGIEVYRPGQGEVYSDLYLNLDLYVTFLDSL